MTITLVRPLDLDAALIQAVFAALVTVECRGCFTTARDEDTARDDLGWIVDEDGALVCEDCAAFDGARGAYDGAYFG